MNATDWRDTSRRRPCQFHTREHQQFCRIALGSCAELETQLIIARRREYINAEQFANLDECLDHENRMLVNLIKSLNNNL